MCGQQRATTKAGGGGQRRGKAFIWLMEQHSDKTTSSAQDTLVQGIACPSAWAPGQPPERDRWKRQGIRWERPGDRPGDEGPAPVQSAHRPQPRENRDLPPVITDELAYSEPQEWNHTVCTF